MKRDSNPSPWDFNSSADSPIETFESSALTLSEKQIFANASTHDLTVRFVQRDDYKLGLKNLRVRISLKNKNKFNLNIDAKK